jgi:hypothetical protein
MEKSLFMAYGMRVGENPQSSNYGRYFHTAVLKDGREVNFHADKAVVTDNGDLIAVSNSFWNKEAGKYIDSEQTYTILALAKGEWIGFYSSSVFTGLPVGVDYVYIDPKDQEDEDEDEDEF